MSRDWEDNYKTAAAELLEVYDEILRPLFEPAGAELLDRAMIVPGLTGLDVACGPGTLTFPLAMRIGPRGRVIGADISPAMIEVARAKPVPDGAAPIEWVQAAAGELPMDPDSVDIITCGQGLQFFPDLAGALQEAHTLLRPDGRAVYGFWAAIEQTPLFDALREAIATVDPDLATRFHAGPWALADGEPAAEAASSIGFADVSLEVSKVMSEVPGDPKDAMFRILKATGIASDVASMDEDQLRQLRDAIDREIPRAIDGDFALLTTWVLTLRR